MYVFVVIILLILIYFCCIKKNINEGLENPPGFTNIGEKKQPKPAVALYDFNLEQALDIWKDAGCTEGSKKPSQSNDHWKYEHWKEEALNYKKESDKYFNDHNYYDWTGNISGEEVIKDKKGVKSFPIGIGEARRRCHDSGFNASYTYPKVGDRVKKKRHPTTNKKKTMKGDYYVGTVLSKTGNKIKVMWDSLGSDKSTAPDKKRLVTKDLPVEISRSHSKYNKLNNDNKKFGWPSLKWGRMPERGNNNMEKIDAQRVKWIRGDSKSMVSNKEVYKVEECKKDNETECDYLKCGKRKKAAISNYPVTYVCNGDRKNTSNDQWFCPASGTVSTYYNKNTMCRNFLKAGKPNTYCNERCDARYGSNGCIPFKNARHQKYTTYRRNKCIAEVNGRDKLGMPIKAILKENKKYTKSQIKKTHGFSSITNIIIHGRGRCKIFKNGGKRGYRWINGSFNSIIIKEEDLRVKVYTKIGRQNYGLRAARVKGKNPRYQFYGAMRAMSSNEKNAIWVRPKYGAETFTWKNGKLCTISPKKCCLEWDGQRGGGSEWAKGVYSKERNAKFDCKSGGDKFTYSRNRIKPVGSKRRCTMEWSSKKFSAITRYRGRRRWGWLKSRQGKFDCSGGGDYIRMVNQN
tara:strand:+ start:230 stop:2119 length:1890 start_codon:yes stop_codon:yes gene_type:complete